MAIKRSEYQIGYNMLMIDQSALSLSVIGAADGMNIVVSVVELYQINT